MANKWQERLGSSYYHFTYHNVLFLCINTQDPPVSSFSNQQLEYFRKALKDNKNVRWTLVFMHHPMWKEKNYENWQKFESLLAHRPYTVFAGHKHRYNKSVRNGQRYYVLALTGGAGSKKVGKSRELLGLAKCQFDQIVWVTMTNDGPVMANLLLEGVLDDEPCPQ